MTDKEIQKFIAAFQADKAEKQAYADKFADLLPGTQIEYSKARTYGYPVYHGKCDNCERNFIYDIFYDPSDWTYILPQHICGDCLEQIIDKKRGEADGIK